MTDFEKRWEKIRIEALLIMKKLQTSFHQSFINLAVDAELKNTENIFVTDVVQQEINTKIF